MNAFVLAAEQLGLRFKFHVEGARAPFATDLSIGAS